MHDEPISIEHCGTLAYSELETYSEPCQVSVMGNFILNSGIFIKNPGIFRTQGIISIMSKPTIKYFIQSLV